MKVCAIMVVRDEATLIERNINYHLELGFDHIFILDHHSLDETYEILNRIRIARNNRITIFREQNPIFDHEKYANQLLNHALKEINPDWIFHLDADEFLGVGTPVHRFLSKISALGISYATIKWLNALHDLENQLPLSDPLNATYFYEPWPERNWQHEGHFRKAFCLSHDNMSVVAGGHFYRWQCNPQFFSPINNRPTELTLGDAKLYHYETRGNVPGLIKKWRNLAFYIVEPNAPENAPWKEKITYILKLLLDYENYPEIIESMWFREPRTFWGTSIPSDRIYYDRTIYDWNLKWGTAI